jgi:hypothetical protein
MFDAESRIQSFGDEIRMDAAKNVAFVVPMLFVGLPLFCFQLYGTTSALFC